MSIDLKITSEVLEKAKLRAKEKGFNGVEHYVLDLVLRDLEGIEDNKLFNDPFLLNFFRIYYEDVCEEFQQLVNAEKEKRGVKTRSEIPLKDRIRFAQTVVKKKWVSLNPNEQKFWNNISEKWYTKVYKDYCLKDLMESYKTSKTVTEFARKFGVSYGVAYYTIKPKLENLLKDFDKLRVWYVPSERLGVYVFYDESIILL